MRYSYSTQFKTKQHKDEMLNFLNKNLKSLSNLTNGEIPDIRGPTDDVSYASEDYPHTIGFDYSGDGSSEEAFYKSRLCIWMAFKNGLVKSFGKDLLKFITYDSDEDNPIISDNNSITDPSYLKIDDNGFCKPSSNFKKFFSFPQIASLVKKEIEILNRRYPY